MAGLLKVWVLCKRVKGVPLGKNVPYPHRKCDIHQFLHSMHIRVRFAVLRFQNPIVTFKGSSSSPGGIGGSSKHVLYVWWKKPLESHSDHELKLFWVFLVSVIP